MDLIDDGDEIHFEHEGVGDANSPILRCFVKGKNAPFAIIESREANQLARWSLIKKDLQFSEAQLVIALNRISKLKKSTSALYTDTEGVIIKSLVDAAIVGYVKCFNQTKGRRVKLEIINLFSTQTGKKHLENHILLANLRNSYIAHAGISNGEGSQMIATVDPTNSEGGIRAGVVAHASYIPLSVETISKIHKTVRYVLSEHSNWYQNKLGDFASKVRENPEQYGVEHIFRSPT